MRAISVLFITCVCAGQQAPNSERIRAAMQASIEAQRASVRTQQQKSMPSTTVAASADSFFTVPWASAVPVVSLPAPPGECDAIAEPQLANLINDAATREQMKPAILRAVIERESAGKPCAVSAKGAQGLMQLMPATAAQFNVDDPFDPKQNVDAGTKLLKQLLSKYGNDLSLALGAYNAGSGRVDKDGSVPEIPETQSYVTDILERVKALESLQQRRVE